MHSLDRKRSEYDCINPLSRTGEWTRVADGRDRAVRPWMTSALDATSYDAS